MLEIGQKAPNFNYATSYQDNMDFYAELGGKNILMFSRYIGCSLCQLKLMEMKEGYEAFAAAGAKVFFVLQSTAENAKGKIEELEIPFDVILDPQCKLYELYDVPAAKSKAGLVSPKALKLIDQAKKLGIEHGAYEGNELQLPAVFILDDIGNIQYARYAKNLGDLPGNDELLKLLG